MNTVSLKSASCQAVFVETNSTGRHSGTDTIGLHEAILSRQRIERSGESLIIEKEWPDHIPRVQARNLSEEYPRLVKKYGKPDVVAIYGEPHTGRLRSVMERIHTAFGKGMPVTQIIELGRPDSDLMDITGGIEPPAGLKVPEDRRPSLSAALREAEAEGGAEQPRGIDDIEDQPEKTLDGNLVEYLKGLAWQEPDALAVARLVMEHGIRSLPDEPLKALRSFGNAAARKKIRNNLASYDPKVVASS